MITKRRGFTLVELMVVIGILGLLVGILAVAVLPKLLGAKADLEKKQMGELVQALQQATIDSNNRKELTKMKDKAGRAFWNDCFRKKILDRELIGKIVCLGSPQDTRADSAFLDDPNGQLGKDNCSYTSPKGGELLNVMNNFKGSKKVVLITFDSRNWFSYKDKGALCAWSEGDAPDYMTQEAAKDEHKIDASNWDHPEQIIGQKKPFDKTFEDKGGK